LSVASRAASIPERSLETQLIAINGMMVFARFANFFLTFFRCYEKINLSLAEFEK